MTNTPTVADLDAAGYSCTTCDHHASAHIRGLKPDDWKPDQNIGALATTVTYRCHCGCTGQRFHQPIHAA
jgi:hypothetical protein